MSGPEHEEERILVLAPEARDAEDISAAAVEGSFTVEVVPDMASLCHAVRAGAGALMLVEASFSPAEVASLRETLLEQPPWSELPILVLAADVEREEARLRMLHLADLLAPVPMLSFWERPLFRRMLIGRFAAALRVRRRQYAARTQLEQLDLERRRGLAVLSALPVGTFVTDANGSMIETNPAFQRIWGALPVGKEYSIFKAWPVGVEHEARPFEWRVSRVLATG
jgi:PAS domain-containing protein